MSYYPIAAAANHATDAGHEWVAAVYEAEAASREYWEHMTTPTDYYAGSAWDAEEAAYTRYNNERRDESNV